METKVLVKALRLWTLCFVKVNNIPLLTLASIVAPYLNCLSFFIFTASNIKDLVVVPVDELAVLILKDLEPS
jgi:hypothetical protein